MFGVERLDALLTQTQDDSLRDVIRKVSEAVIAYHCKPQFDDDLSMLAIEIA